MWIDKFIKGNKIQHSEICDVSSGHLFAELFHELILCVLDIDGLKHCIYLHSHRHIVWIKPAGCCVFTSGTISYNCSPSFLFSTGVNLILYLSCYTAVWCNKKRVISVQLEVDSIQCKLKQTLFNSSLLILLKFSSLIAQVWKVKIQKFPLLQNECRTHSWRLSELFK